MKVLVRAPQWLGDAVVSTIFLERLKKKFPANEIHVAAPKALEPLFSTHPSVSHFVPLPYPQGFVWNAVSALKKQNYDEAYILPRSFRSAFEGWASKIPVRNGFGGDWRRYLLTKTFPYDATAFYPHRYLRLIDEQNLPLGGMRPYFPVTDLGFERAAERLGVAVSLFQRPLLGLAPASVAPSRTWLADGFSEVGRRFIKEKSGTVLLFGSPKEQPLTARIAEKIGAGAVDVAGKLSFPELGWMMKNCGSFVGNDSGLMHVASAVGVPSVILFGASDPKTALPQTGHFMALQHPEVPCVPCLRNHCPRFGSYHIECLKTISPDEVMDALAHV